MGTQVTTPEEVEAAVAEVNRQFAIVRQRERERVEALRSSKVVPHERGEE